MCSSHDIAVRPITEDEIPAWLHALDTGFLRAPTALSAQELKDRTSHIAPPRALAAFDESRTHTALLTGGTSPAVATFRSFSQELTTVGGGTVPADAISNVTVSPSHRRRGILTRMMAHDLTAAKERGDVVATLIAAEYPIYGRYGFGPATSTTEWTIDVPRTGLDPRWSGPADGGRVDLVDGAAVRALGPALHDRLRHAQPGAVSRDERWWRVNTGDLRTNSSWDEPFYAVYRSAAGEIEGLVSYAADDNWQRKQPHDTAGVNWLIATTPAAERALWHYLSSIDWITKVKSGWRAPDDLLPHFFPDPRAASVTTQADWLWVRILDVVRALEARTYAGTGTLVLEIVDRDSFADGRYRLDAGPDGGSCVPTSEDGDLVLEAADLATLWLGDESAVRLAALGRVREQRKGAASMADALLRTSRRPWCPDIF